MEVGNYVLVGKQVQTTEEVPEGHQTDDQRLIKAALANGEAIRMAIFTW